MERCQLSIIVLAKNEAINLKVLLPALRRVASQCDQSFEIIVVDGQSIDQTPQVAVECGAYCIRQAGGGYGTALREGIAASSGAFVVTMDADLSHPPEMVSELWRARYKSDVVVASRYVGPGDSRAPLGRRLLSHALNWCFRRFLHLPCSDISGGLRLYTAGSISVVSWRSPGFSALEEILCRLHWLHHSIAELPYVYRPRGGGRSKARIIVEGVSAMILLYRLRVERQSQVRTRDPKR